MSCKCLKELAEMLKDLNQTDTIEFTNLMMQFKFTGGSQVALEPLRYRYHRKKKDGSVSKKWFSGSVFFSYCPFCGTKYEDIKSSKRKSRKK